MIEAPSCRVCGRPVEAIYRSNSRIALNSSAEVLDAATNVDFCPSCGHAQTQPIPDLAKYYSSEYNFRAGSSEEDDLCTSSDAQAVYRSDLQAAILERKLSLSNAGNVLDYGSGKARTLRLLTQRYPEMRPHAFDVSDVYREYWSEFIPPQAQASYEIPGEWRGYFDVVLSFFALEHVERPAAFVAELRSLLRPGGRAAIVLPNMYSNVSDFIVVDHINHFSAGSLMRLFREGGFEHVGIDDAAQPGWYVVDAMLGAPKGSTMEAHTQSQDAREIAGYWNDLGRRVRDVEAEFAGRRFAIYGSGIYGLFIASALRQPEGIACFLDRNPFRHGLSFFGAPVVAPEEIPDGSDVVFVGLNPLHARDVIAAVPALARIPREYFFV